MFSTILGIIHVQLLLAIIVIISNDYNNTWIKMFYLKYRKLCRFNWEVFSIEEGFWQRAVSNIRDMKLGRWLTRLHISEKVFSRTKACWTCLCAKRETAKMAENVKGDEAKDGVGYQKSCEGITLDGSLGCGQRHIFFSNKIKRRRETCCREISVEF